MNTHFEVTHRFRPFAVVSPGFEQVTHPDPRVIAGPVDSGISPVAPFAAIEVTLDDIGRGGITLGMSSPDSHVAVTVNGSLIQIQERYGDRVDELRRRRSRLPAGTRFAFVVCGDRVAALRQVGRDWQTLAAATTTVDVTPRHHYTWGSALESGSTVSQLSAGPFGMVGLRDLHLVQAADGRPYVRDGSHYLTATCAGPGFFTAAHMGVFAFDPAEPQSLTQVAHLYTRRDGRVLGDHAGQVVADDGRWIVVTSSWGDFEHDGVHVRHTSTTDDVLHGVHVLDTVPLAMPTTHSSWDPGLTRIDDRWHLTFVESPGQRPFRFHPALAVGAPGADYTDGFELVGADTGRRKTEGPILARVGSDWRVLASDGGRRTYPVYDLSMHHVGDLDAPYGSNIGHPQVLALADGGSVLLTFDGTSWDRRRHGYGTHGDVVVMRG